MVKITTGGCCELEQVARELDAVHVGHVDVGEDELGGRGLQQVERLAAVLRLADDRERQRAGAVVEQLAQPPAGQAPRRRRSVRATHFQPRCDSWLRHPLQGACRRGAIAARRRRVRALDVDSAAAAAGADSAGITRAVGHADVHFVAVLG